MLPLSEVDPQDHAPANTASPTSDENEKAPYHSNESEPTVEIEELLQVSARNGSPDKPVELSLEDAFPGLSDIPELKHYHTAKAYADEGDAFTFDEAVTLLDYVDTAGKESPTGETDPGVPVDFLLRRVPMGEGEAYDPRSIPPLIELTSSIEYEQLPDDEKLAALGRWGSSANRQTNYRESEKITLAVEEQKEEERRRQIVALAARLADGDPVEEETIRKRANEELETRQHYRKMLAELPPEKIPARIGPGPDKRHLELADLVETLYQSHEPKFSSEEEEIDITDGAKVRIQRISDPVEDVFQVTLPNGYTERVIGKTADEAIRSVVSQNVDAFPNTHWDEIHKVLNANAKSLVNSAGGLTTMVGETLASFFTVPLLRVNRRVDQSGSGSPHIVPTHEILKGREQFSRGLIEFSRFEKADELIDSYIPTSPRESAEYYLGKNQLRRNLLSAFGEMLASVEVGLASGYAAPYTLTAQNVGIIMDSNIEDALAHGVPPEDVYPIAIEATLKQAPLEVVSDLVIDRGFRRAFGKFLDIRKPGTTSVLQRRLKEGLKNTSATVATNVSAETAQQAIANEVARKYYDENRSLFEGMPESAAISAITALVFGGGAETIGLTGDTIRQRLNRSTHTNAPARATSTHHGIPGDGTLPASTPEDYANSLGKFTAENGHSDRTTLNRWAREYDLTIDHADLGDPQSTTPGGATVHRHADVPQRILRTPAENLGMHPTVHNGKTTSVPVTPEQYIARKKLENDVFDNGATFVGVTNDHAVPDSLAALNSPSAVVTAQTLPQNYQPATETEISTFLAEHEFALIDEEQNIYYRSSDRMTIVNADEDHFVTGDEGTVPVDPDIAQLTPEQVAEANLDNGGSGDSGNGGDDGGDSGDRPPGDFDGDDVPPEDGDDGDGGGSGDDDDNDDSVYFHRAHAFPELRKRRNEFQDLVLEATPETLKSEAGYLYDEHTAALEERLALKDAILVRDPNVDSPVHRRAKDGTVEVVIPDPIPDEVAAKTPSEIARYVEDTVRRAEFEPIFKKAVETEYAGRARELEQRSDIQHRKKVTQAEKNLQEIEKQLAEKEAAAEQARANLKVAHDNLARANKAIEAGGGIDLETFQSAVKEAEETVAKTTSSLERFQSTIERKRVELDELRNSEPPKADPKALFENHAGEEIDKLITSFTPAKKRVGNPEALHEVLLGLKQASQDALPDHPLKGDSLADLQSELTSRDGSGKTTILSRFVYEVSNLIVFGVDSHGRATTESPYHNAAIAVNRPSSNSFPIRRLIQKTHAEMAAMDDAMRFEKGIARYLDDPDFQKGSYTDDGKRATRIIRELGIGMNSNSLYLKTEPQPVTIARPLNGGKPTVAMPKNRSIAKDRKNATNEIEAFMKSNLGIPTEGKLPDYLATAIEHSEAISIWLLDPVDIDGFDLDPENPEGPALAITTAGQYICGFCVGQETSDSGAVEIAIARNYNKIILSSYPTGEIDAFQTEFLQNAEEVTATAQKGGRSYKIEITRER